MELNSKYILVGHEENLPNATGYSRMEPTALGGGGGGV